MTASKHEPFSLCDVRMSNPYELDDKVEDLVFSAPAQQQRTSSNPINHSKKRRSS